MTEAERKAWNAAIEAAWRLADAESDEWDAHASEYEQGCKKVARYLARNIRSLTKPEPTE